MTAVEAPRAALGVLPLARHEPLRLELAQQRVHRVRVDGDQAAADLADALHQPPAVRRLLAQEVQHEQRQQPGAAQLADERVLRARAARAGGGLGRLQRRGLGDGAIRAARGHRP